MKFLSPTILALLATGCGPKLDASFDANPICGLSTVVTWSTDEPTSSWVEVSQGDEPLFRVGDDVPVMEHEVIVVGMTEQQDYQIEAVSVTDGGRELRSETQDFTTDALPHPWLQGHVSILDPDAVQPGWTATNVMTASIGPVIAELLNEAGQVVWYYIHDGDDGGADIQVSWFADTREMLIGPHVAGGEHAVRIDLKGVVSWEGPEQPGDPDAINIQDGQLHHVLWETDDGGHVAVQCHYEQVGDEDVQGDRVVWLDADNDEQWSWSAFDHLEYDPDDVFMGLWWTHLNSVAFDEEQDVAYINSWVQSKVWKVDRATGEILWTLGEGGDFAADPDHETPWFEMAHSVDPIGDNHFIMHDNGSNDRHWSRVVEYALDETTMQAEIVWEYPGDLVDDQWYVVSCGDVDLLDNDNRLVVANTRIMEITPGGERVFEYNWIPVDETPDLRSYQAERIEALVETL